MNVTYESLDPWTITEQDWKEYHVYRKQYHADNTPDEPFIDDKTFENIVKAEFSNEQAIVEVLKLTVNNEIAGNLFIQMFRETAPSYKGNENLMMFKIELGKKFRRQGLGSQVLIKVVKLAEKYNRNSLITSADEEDGKKFLKSIGAKIGLAMRENRLYIKDVDWEMVNRWIREGENLNPDTKLVKFNKVPEDLIENYCKTFTFAGNQAPRDDLEMGDMVVTPGFYRKREEENEKAGIVTELAVTIEKNGKVSGLTEIIALNSVEKVLRQGLTAVLEEERGRKLGKWLKANLLLHVKDKYPNLEYIQTGNAFSNGPMLAINEKLGFKMHKEMINSQISLDSLKKYLQNKHLISIVA